MIDRVVIPRAKFLIVKPTNTEDYMPLACPVCDTLMCLDDSASWTRFKCCTRCADAWAYKAQKQWDDGWRPPAGEVRSNFEARPKMHVNVHAL